MTRVEVITGRERRRSWNDEQKRKLVAEAFAPGAKVADVARCADVQPGQIYRWRREISDRGSGFAPVVVAPVEPVARPTATAAIEVELAGRVSVRIPASIPPALAEAVVRVLVTR
jgi:transposase